MCSVRKNNITSLNTSNKTNQLSLQGVYNIKGWYSFEQFWQMTIYKHKLWIGHLTLNIVCCWDVNKCTELTDLSLICFTSTTVWCLTNFKAYRVTYNYNGTVYKNVMHIYEQ